jgi:hypothetical protein
VTDRSELEGERGGEDRGARPQRGDDAPLSAEEALRRARGHARLAARESLLALRWLLEAAGVAATGVPSEELAWLHRLISLVESSASNLGEEGRPVASRLLESVAAALEDEIARWEERGREDSEARAVLRAFLGLRELLWEFGVRPGEASTPQPGGSRAAPRPPNSGLRSSRTPSRVERVPVEG